MSDPIRQQPTFIPAQPPMLVVGERRIAIDEWPLARSVEERRIGFRRVPRVERTCPLNAIQAVQLLYNGRHSVTEPEGAGERQTISYREFFCYELNLVLDDPQAPRLNLFNCSDWHGSGKPA